MNIQYISGFFDADGSITMVRSSRSAYFRHPKIDFSNTQLTILQEIQNWLTEQGIKSYISEKPTKKKNHSTSYTLGISYNSALQMCKLLTSHHPIKKHRIATINKYYSRLTKRNGKYTEREKQSKFALERLFFWSSIS